MGNDKRLLDTSSLGSIAICKEAFRLLREHARLYFWSLQYAVLFPCSVMLTLTAFVFYVIGNPGPDSGSNSVQSTGGPSSSSYLVRAVQGGQWSIVGAVLLLEFLVLMIALLAATIWTSPVAYSAGLVCAGKPASLSDALHAIPLFWKRIVATNLAFFAIVYGIGLLVTVVAACLTFAAFHSELYTILLSILVAEVTMIILVYTFLLAPLVPVLGDGSGFGALWKGRKLLQGKRKVAYRVIALSNIPVYLIMWFIFKAFQAQARVDLWSYRVLLIGLVLIVCSSLVTPWMVMCEVVLYKSCKAYNGEDIADSISPVEGYQLVNSPGFVDIEACSGTTS